MNREYHFSKSLRFLIGVAALGIARADGVAQGAPIRGTRGYMSPEQQ